MHSPRNIQGGYTATDFWNNWSSVNPRISLFLLITPQSFWTGASSLGFTTNTRNMTLPGHPGVTFYSSPGISPSVIEMALGQTVNLEMMGLYQSGLFEYEDITAGKWDYATVEVFSASWDSTAINYGELLWAKTNLSDFKDYQTYFNAEGRGYISRLSNETDKVTTRTCRVLEFGDSECGKDLSGTVEIDGTDYLIQQTAVDGVQAIAFDSIHFDTATFDGNVPPDAPTVDLYAPYFNNGKIKALSGANAGVSREIASGQPFGTEMDIYLKRLFPYPITGTISFELTMGCVRTTEDCTKFTNIENFRGEPFVPGIESVNRID